MREPVEKLNRRVRRGRGENGGLLSVSIPITHSALSAISAVKFFLAGFKHVPIHPSIMVVRRFHTLGAGQFADERLWIVDQHGQMLWTDPILPILKLECDQGNLLPCAITHEAIRFIRMIVAHGSSSTFLCAEY
jgi:hypothetical protein